MFLFLPAVFTQYCCECDVAFDVFDLYRRVISRFGSGHDDDVSVVDFRDTVALLSDRFDRDVSYLAFVDGRPWQIPILCLSNRRFSRRRSRGVDQVRGVVYRDAIRFAETDTLILDLCSRYLEDVGIPLPADATAKYGAERIGYFDHRDDTRYWET